MISKLQESSPTRQDPTRPATQLGVIHPSHKSQTRESPKKDLSDLRIVSNQATINQRGQQRSGPAPKDMNSWSLQDVPVKDRTFARQSATEQRENTATSQAAHHQKKASTQLHKTGGFNPYSSIEMDFDRTKDIEAATNEQQSFRFKATRSQLIDSGVVEFSSFLDADGSVFDPKDRFGTKKPKHLQLAQEQNGSAEETQFLTHMSTKVPAGQQAWYIMPHHLKSITNHPLSVNDHPNFTNYGDLNGRGGEPEEKKRQVAATSIAHLEKVIEDLKAERDDAKKSLKKKSYTSKLDEIDQFRGWLTDDPSAYKYNPRNFDKDPSPNMAKLEDLKEKESTLMYAYFKEKEGQRRKAPFMGLVQNTLNKFRT